MTTETRFKQILTATPEQLARIDEVLEGKTATTKVADIRLLTFSDAARALQVSRQTIWRMVNDGRLRVVEIRDGCRRVPAVALTELTQGGAQ